MPNVKTGALLPSGEENGLQWIAGELVEEGALRRPKRLRAVLGIIDARRVNVDSDNGQELVTIRFRRVELLLPGDLPAAEKLIRRALEARSGQTTLPLDLEDEITQAFAEMADPESAVDPDEPIDLVPGPGGGDGDQEDGEDQEDDGDAWNDDDGTDPEKGDGEPGGRLAWSAELAGRVLRDHEFGGVGEIMADLGCSERHARRLLARARAELGEGPEGPDGEAGRDGR
ncbi:MAG: hypothetical protein J2P30_15670 [Actinobacteria bacterium]|nr:hypothetical protein [Actinomycetota bacterium]